MKANLAKAYVMRINNSQKIRVMVSEEKVENFRDLGSVQKTEDETVNSQCKERKKEFSWPVRHLIKRMDYFLTVRFWKRVTDR